MTADVEVRYINASLLTEGVALEPKQYKHAVYECQEDSWNFYEFFIPSFDRPKTLDPRDGIKFFEWENAKD